MAKHEDICIGTYQLRYYIYQVQSPSAFFFFFLQVPYICLSAKNCLWYVCSTSLLPPNQCLVLKRKIFHQYKFSFGFVFSRLVLRSRWYTYATTVANKVLMCDIVLQIYFFFFFFCVVLHLCFFTKFQTKVLLAAAVSHLFTLYSTFWLDFPSISE